MRAVTPLWMLTVSMAIPGTGISEDTKAVTKAPFESKADEVPSIFQYGSQDGKDREASPSEVVEMDTMTITESLQRRYIKKAIDEKSAAIEAEKFKFYKGGLLKRTQIGGVQADLGLWPKLEIYGPGEVGPKADPMLKVDVLHLRW